MSWADPHAPAHARTHRRRRQPSPPGAARGLSSPLLQRGGAGGDGGAPPPHPPTPPRPTASLSGPSVRSRATRRLPRGARAGRGRGRGGLRAGGGRGVAGRAGAGRRAPRTGGVYVPVPGVEDGGVGLRHNLALHLLRDLLAEALRRLRVLQLLFEARLRLRPPGGGRPLPPAVRPLLRPLRPTGPALPPRPGGAPGRRPQHQQRQQPARAAAAGPRAPGGPAPPPLPAGAAPRPRTERHGSAGGRLAARPSDARNILFGELEPREVAQERQELPPSGHLTRYRKGRGGRRGGNSGLPDPFACLQRGRAPPSTSALTGSGGEVALFDQGPKRRRARRPPSPS